MKTQVFTLFSSSPNDRDLAQIAAALKKGAVIIYPTDTVYALGCLSKNAVALDKIARLKNIKLEKAPLSFLFKDISELSNYVKPFDAKVFRLLKSTLPGPYAFVMEAVTNSQNHFKKERPLGLEFQIILF